MKLWDWLTGRTALRRLVADLLQANAALRGQLEQAERVIAAARELIGGADDGNGPASR